MVHLWCPDVVGDGGHDDGKFSAIFLFVFLQNIADIDRDVKVRRAAMKFIRLNQWFPAASRGRRDRT